MSTVDDILLADDRYAADDISRLESEGGLVPTDDMPADPSELSDAYDRQLAAEQVAEWTAPEPDTRPATDAISRR